ncbi:LacI family DNA-binding transcriptional regulator [Caulobacter soli]|uniref:LacI family DNA-binding transcriptional regulator n=1 Tax=Caulobacter soli TaxID=2708539 RepID=UPI0013EE185C|nr:LacI family DNA-binding transcriptional regulator [Caulobacter soli]
MAKRPATIIHVAEKARVSVKTVSRVLNNEPNVTPDLKARVLEAVDKLGYSPSKAARTMAGSRSYLLVAFNDRRLTLDNWRSERGNEWIDQMLYGAMLRCERSGYHLMFELVDRESDQLERQITAVLSSLQPDGVILTPPNCENPVVLGALKKRNIPFVRLNTPVRGQGPRVYMDDRAAARQATKHLLGLGHTRIGMIAGDYRFSSSIERVEMFQATMEAAGIPVPEAYVFKGDFTFEAGVAGATALLGLPEAPTAILASNDQMALGVVSVAQGRGMRIPADLSIVSFDDAIGVRMSVPPLTAVRQPVAKMAEMAADLLINASASGDKLGGGSTLVPFELMVRASTGPAPK